MDVVEERGGSEELDVGREEVGEGVFVQLEILETRELLDEGDENAGRDAVVRRDLVRGRRKGVCVTLAAIPAQVRAMDSKVANERPKPPSVPSEPLDEPRDVRLRSDDDVFEDEALNRLTLNSGHEGSRAQRGAPICFLPRRPLRRPGGGRGARGPR